MSYFCAKAIKIDRASHTFKVRGGDNNVVPRSDYWSSGDEPTAMLLPEVASGCVQFTTRSEKHLRLEAIIYHYDKQVQELTGFNAYDLWAVMDKRKDRAELRTNYLKSAADYDTSTNFTGDYAKKQAEHLRGLAKLLDPAEPLTLINLDDLVSKFVHAIENPGTDRRKYVLQGHGFYITKIGRRHAQTTSNIERALRVSKIKADEVTKRFNVVAVEVAV